MPSAQSVPAGAGRFREPLEGVRLRPGFPLRAGRLDQLDQPPG